jgi:hypothetical protein
MMLALAPWLASMSVIVGTPTIGVEPPNLTGRASENDELFQREIDQAVAAHGTPTAAAQAQYRVRVSVGEAERDYTIQLELLDASGASVAKTESSCDICAETEAAAQTGRDLAAFLATNVKATNTVVRITSTPSGATVRIDGTEVGTTPYEAAIEPGDHQVAIERDGYTASSREFAAAEGKQSELHVDLEGRAAPRKPAREPSPRAQKGAWIGGWVGIGVGVALLTTGIALLAIDGNDIKNDCSGANMDAFGRCKYRYETTGGGAAATLLGVAFAGAGTGLVVWSRPKKKNSAELKAHFGPRRVGLTLRF